MALQLGCHYPDLQPLVGLGKMVRVDRSKVALQFGVREIKMTDLLITAEGEIEGYSNENHSRTQRG